jgi:hypothetical protein
MKNLIVRSNGWWCNLSVTKIEKIDDVVFAYRDDEFIGMFSLGSIDALYLSEKGELK